MYSSSNWDNYSYATYVQLKPNIDATQFNNKIKNEAEEYLPGIGAKLFYILSADDEFAQKLTSETQTATLAALFAGLTIFISCLGLFGLAAYMAELRSKEIGIRKVLGASIASITNLLSKEFVLLVLIAIVIATPVGWLAMNKWLQNYTYRISLNWIFFVAAGLLAIIIAVVTVSSRL